MTPEQDKADEQYDALEGALTDLDAAHADACEDPSTTDDVLESLRLAMQEAQFDYEACASVLGIVPWWR